MTSNGQLDRPFFTGGLLSLATLGIPVVSVVLADLLCLGEHFILIPPLGTVRLFLPELENSGYWEFP